MAKVIRRSLTGTHLPAVVTGSAIGATGTLGLVTARVAPPAGDTKARLDYLDQRITDVQDEARRGDAQIAESVRRERDARTALEHEVRRQLSEIVERAASAEAHAVRINAGALPAVAFGTLLSGLDFWFGSWPLLAWLCTVALLTVASGVAVTGAVRAWWAARAALQE